MDSNNTRKALTGEVTGKHRNSKTLTLQLFAGPHQIFLQHLALAYLPNRIYIAGLAPWRTVSRAYFQWGYATYHG